MQKPGWPPVENGCCRERLGLLNGSLLLRLLLRRSLQLTLRILLQPITFDTSAPLCLPIEYRKVRPFFMGRGKLLGCTGAVRGCVHERRQDARFEAAREELPRLFQLTFEPK